jgi:ubiquinone/menaquinone biosynthesis C-methylase UbiE
MSQAERVEREREFHNQRFADDSEREDRLGRFYTAIAYGFDLYRRRVKDEARGRSFLEYGCGTGSVAFDLAGSAKQVTGIDISDVAIHKAKQTARRKGLGNVEFVVDNAESMQLPDKSVDVIAGSGIVHHLDIPKAMAEVRRVLRSGGIAIFAEPLGHNPVLNWYRNRTPELRTPDEHPLLMKDLQAMAEGFAWTRVTYFGLVAPLLGLWSRDVRPGSRLTRLVWWLDKRLCRIPGLRRQAWYCLIEIGA